MRMFRRSLIVVSMVIIGLPGFPAIAAPDLRNVKVDIDNSETALRKYFKGYEARSKLQDKTTEEFELTLALGVLACKRLAAGKSREQILKEDYKFAQTLHPSVGAVTFRSSASALYSATESLCPQFMYR